MYVSFLLKYKTYNYYTCINYKTLINDYFIYRANEVKEHAFFRGIDWTQVFLQKYTPPLIPPRGEVNAADAFDIGSFDEEDTKGIKVSLQYDVVLHKKISWNSIPLVMWLDQNF